MAEAARDDTDRDKMSTPSGDQGTEKSGRDSQQTDQPLRQSDEKKKAEFSQKPPKSDNRRWRGHQQGLRHTTPHYPEGQRGGSAVSKTVEATGRRREVFVVGADRVRDRKEGLYDGDRQREGSRRQGGRRDMAERDQKIDEGGGRKKGGGGGGGGREGEGSRRGRRRGGKEGGENEGREGGGGGGRGGGGKGGKGTRRDKAGEGEGRSGGGEKSLNVDVGTDHSCERVKGQHESSKETLESKGDLQTETDRRERERTRVADSHKRGYRGHHGRKEEGGGQGREHFGRRGKGGRWWQEERTEDRQWKGRRGAEREGDWRRGKGGREERGKLEKRKEEGEKEVKSVEEEPKRKKVEAGPFRILQRERPEEERTNTTSLEDRAHEMEMTPNGHPFSQEREEERDAVCDGGGRKEKDSQVFVPDKHSKSSSKGDYGSQKNQKEHQSGSRKRLQPKESPSDGWRCPACQHPSTIVPTLYKCYCGKVTNPRPRSKGELTVPHSCGELCGRSLAVTPESSCKHECQLLCHPGPCPPCPVTVHRTCPCGRRSYQVRCSKSSDLPSCGSPCGRELSCGRHCCDQPCHSGPCSICQVLLTQQCYCGRSQRDVVCGEKERENYSCGLPCGKELDCGNHLCELSCHPPPCPSCPLLPKHVTTCPCGATPLSILLPPDHARTSCLDPIPTCERVCGKRLPCSTHAEPHFCPAPCHEGTCPPCEKSRTIWCRCGKGSVRVDCEEVEGVGEYQCGRPCNKMKSCGRHRCNNRCCVDSTHQCDLICGKKLQCGQHYCNERCHKGHCDQCWEYSYSELKCHCGAAVLYPPIPCGTPPPACGQLCARIHPCGHPVTHSCHSEEECPPCTHLTEKMCMGEHELRHHIPCHITDVSCGVPCGKPLPCGDHNCQKTCHRGPCMDATDKCKQPCPRDRKYCRHACAEPCHVGADCPDTPCKAVVVLTCKCGRKKESVVCGASGSGVMQQAFHKVLSKDLGAKIHDLQSGHSVSLGSVTLSSLGRDGEQLECDEVCSQEERNRNLAAALGIQRAVINPLEPSLPRYSETLLDLARTKAHLPTVSLTKMIDRERFKAPPAPVSLSALSKSGTEKGRGPSPLHWPGRGERAMSPQRDRGKMEDTATTDYFADDLKL